MRRPRKLLEQFVKSVGNISVADLRAFIAYYARLEDSALADELAGAKQVLLRLVKKAPSPPAGLKAREAIPIVLAYVREEKHQDVALTKQERGSFGAMAEALDRQFGTGFTERVVNELNAMPNGSQSMHYRK